MTTPTQSSIQRILVAHDFHATSEAALNFALSVAARFGASITVVHAYEIPSMGAPEVLVLATDYLSQITAAARKSLDDVVARARESGVPVESELREGAAWSQINEVARARHADLVVVGSHGRRGLPRALLGSVAEKVVRTAPCPVLVVRGAGEGE
jgi:nucleotide-binding universal stress UspA family protein